jgi:hypothetical protein
MRYFVSFFISSVMVFAYTILVGSFDNENRARECAQKASSLSAKFFTEDLHEGALFEAVKGEDGWIVRSRELNESMAIGAALSIAPVFGNPLLLAKEGEKDIDLGIHDKLELGEDEEMKRWLYLFMATLVGAMAFLHLSGNIAKSEREQEELQKSQRELSERMENER